MRATEHTEKLENILKQIIGICNQTVNLRNHLIGTMPSVETTAAGVESTAPEGFFPYADNLTLAIRQKLEDVTDVLTSLDRELFSAPETLKTNRLSGVDPEVSRFAMKYAPKDVTRGS